VRLPEEIENFIQEQIKYQKLDELKAARELTSNQYKHGKSSYSSFQSNLGLLSYLITRMPATYGASMKVFELISRLLPDYSPKTLWDLGAGPGTASWAALNTFSSLEKIKLIEREKEIVDLGKKICSLDSRWGQSEWLQSSLEQVRMTEPVDLAVFSYVLAESFHLETLSYLFHAEVTIVIEPGTPKGFERIRTLRTYLLKNNFNILAPCSHAQNCPMADPDWCHFYARIERSRLHRLLKNGSMGYEDEKFCYLVFSKNLKSSFSAIMIAPPEKRHGYLEAKVCSSNGCLETCKILKKDKKRYEEARKLDWGDFLA
jgi:ribosomal protein RSM22 (predicted rRNA methylase)